MIQGTRVGRPHRNKEWYKGEEMYQDPDRVKSLLAASLVSLARSSLHKERHQKLGICIEGLNAPAWWGAIVLIGFINTINSHKGLFGELREQEVYLDGFLSGIQGG